MASDMDALFGAQVKAGDNQLKNIAALINEEGERNDELATLEAMADSVKARRSELRNKLIPEAMLDAQMREFTTEEGIKAKITFNTDGSLGSPKTPEEYQAREEKYDIIEAHGGGEIIKQLVSVEFPKDMFHEAETFRKWLVEQVKKREWPVNVTRTRTINHQTLGSWIRSKMQSENVKDHIPMPVLEKLGIWYGEIAKITRPKKNAK